MARNNIFKSQGKNHNRPKISQQERDQEEKSEEKHVKKEKNKSKQIEKERLKKGKNVKNDLHKKIDGLQGAKFRILNELLYTRESEDSKSYFFNNR